MFQPFTIVCSACSKSLKVGRESLVGKTVGCPGCQNKMVVRQPKDPGQPAARRSAKSSAAAPVKKQSPPDAPRRRSSAASGSSTTARKKQRSTAKKKRSSGKPWLLPVVGGIIAVVAIGLGAMWFLSSPDTSATDIADSNGAPSTAELSSDTTPESNAGTGLEAGTPVVADPVSEMNAAVPSATANVTTTPSEPPSLDVSALLKGMLELLEQGDTQTFFMKHAPVREYTMITKVMEGGQPFPTFPPQLVGLLSGQIRKMQSMTPVVGADGQSVRFVSSSSGSVSQKPSLQNPLRSNAASALPGYGGDLSAAIQQAVVHLNQNQGEEFASRMLPSSVVAVMKSEGRWAMITETFAAGTDQRTQMLADLNQLLTMTPQIQGDTATYVFDRMVTPFPSGRDRRQTTVKDGTREIRFSRVGGHWRFYDQAAQLADDIDVALNQELKDSPWPDDDLLALENDGAEWRFKALPRKR